MKLYLPSFLSCLRQLFLLAYVIAASIATKVLVSLRIGVAQLLLDFLNNVIVLIEKSLIFYDDSILQLKIRIGIITITLISCFQYKRIMARERIRREFDVFNILNHILFFFLYLYFLFFNFGNAIFRLNRILEIQWYSNTMCLFNQILIQKAFVSFIFTFNHLLEVVIRSFFFDQVQFIITTAIIKIRRFSQHEFTHLVDYEALSTLEKGKQSCSLKPLAEEKLLQIHLLLKIRLTLIYIYSILF